MKFAQIVFRIAGVWGILILTPLYFLFGRVAAENGSSQALYQFYFGFAGVTFAWQVAFLVMARDPVRFRPLMIPAMLEKFVYVVSMAILFGLGRVDMMQASSIVPDCILGLLFVASHRKTRPDNVPAR